MKHLKILFVLLFLSLAVSLSAQQTYPPKYRDHNRVNTCKNLLANYTLDELSFMISTGNFDDIYVGDYIEMEMTTNIGTYEGETIYTTETVRWIVAAINYFKHRTDSEITADHIVLVAEDCFIDPQPMNTSNTTAGGYASSLMYMNILPRYDTAIENAFGSSHVLAYRQILTTSIDENAPSMAGDLKVGCSNNWTWATGETNKPHITKLNLMSEPQLYGTKVLSSSYYDIGINNSQFPLFAQLPEKIICGRGFNASSNARNFFWLSAVVSTVNFACCGSHGGVNSFGASAGNGVRPYFLFK